MNHLLKSVVLVSFLVIGCAERSRSVSHKQLLQIAAGACEKKYNWRDAYADPDLVIFESSALIQVYPDYETSVAETQHPENALVKLELDGTIISIDQE